MRSKSPIVLMLVGLIATGLPVVAEAQNAASVFELAGAEAKYTPGDFKPAPEKMKTRFGNLEFPGGYPTAETSRKVYDELMKTALAENAAQPRPSAPPREVVKNVDPGDGPSKGPANAPVVEELEAALVSLAGIEDAGGIVAVLRHEYLARQAIAERARRQHLANDLVGETIRRRLLVRAIGINDPPHRDTGRRNREIVDRALERFLEAVEAVIDDELHERQADLELFHLLDLDVDALFDGWARVYLLDDEVVSEAQVEAMVQRICGLAKEVRANLLVSIASVPPGASLEKANYVFELVEKHGRY